MQILVSVASFQLFAALHSGAFLLSQDLARWKSRRRSASQDLIKKEAERKKMERLLSGDGTNERRKSIKTYREIVEEKYVVLLKCRGMSENVVCSVGDR